MHGPRRLHPLDDGAALKQRLRLGAKGDYAVQDSQLKMWRRWATGCPPSVPAQWSMYSVTSGTLYRLVPLELTKLLSAGNEERAGS